MNEEAMLQHFICENQAELFSFSCLEELDSKRFIEAYMASPTAVAMDQDYSRFHWMGAAYTLADLESYGKLPKGEVWDRQAMYWMGFLYRFWHFKTGLSSAEIYRRADADTLAYSYYGLHTLDFPMVIDRLTEDWQAKIAKSGAACSARA